MADLKAAPERAGSESLTDRAHADLATAQDVERQVMTARQVREVALRRLKRKAPRLGGAGNHEPRIGHRATWGKATEHGWFS